MSNSESEQPQKPDESARAEQEEAAPKRQTPQDDSGGQALSEALQVSFRFLKLALIALVVFYVLNGVFWVSPGEVKVKLRFGQPVGVGAQDRHVLQPGSGWHIRWPWEQIKTIETAEKSIDVERQFWHYAPPGDREVQQTSTLPPRRDGYLLTGDKNLVHMQIEARYRPRTDEQGALDYMFRVQEPEQLMRRFVYDSIIQVAGRRPVMDILAREKQAVLAGIRNEIEEKLRRFEEKNGFSAGVELTSVDYAQAPIVPRAAQEAFQKARQARRQMDQMITEAEEQKSKILQEGRKTKARLLGEARAYKTRVVELARADASTLEELLTYYEESPAMADIMRQRHYERTIQKVLGESRDAFVLHGTEPGDNRELRILLGRQKKRSGNENEQQQEQQEEQGQSRDPAQSGMRMPGGHQH